MGILELLKKSLLTRDQSVILPQGLVKTPLKSGEGLPLPSAAPEDPGSLRGGLGPSSLSPHMLNKAHSSVSFQLNRS